MSEPRRGFLKMTTAAAIAFAAGGYIGSSTLFDEGDSSGRGYLRWLYDPTRVVSPDSQMFASVDVAAIHERTGQYPVGLERELETVKEEFEKIGVADVQRVTGVGFATGELERAGVTMAATGDFDTSKILAEMNTQIEDLTTTETHDFVQKQYNGYDLHHTSGHHLQYSLVDGYESDVSATLSVKDDVALFGTVLGQDIQSDTTVQHMIDVATGENNSYYDSNSSIGEVIDVIGDSTIMFGGEFDPTQIPGDKPESGRETLKLLMDIGTLGVGVDITDNEIIVTVVLVYDSVQDASREHLQAFISASEEGEADSIFGDVKEISISESGRAISVAMPIDVDELWKSINTNKQ